MRLATLFLNTALTKSVLLETMLKRSLPLCLILSTWSACLVTAADDLDTSPLPVTVERAFPKLKFNRPIVLTHANDGSNRVFIASQLGEIHVLDNDQNASRAKVFFDLTPRVKFKKEQNEEVAGPRVSSPVQGERRVLHLLHDQRGSADLGHLAVSYRKTTRNKADPILKKKSCVYHSRIGTITAARWRLVQTATCTCAAGRWGRRKRSAHERSKLADCARQNPSHRC